MIEVRLAQIEDVYRISEITQEHEPKSIEGYEEAFLQQVNDNFKKDSSSFIFVALKDDLIVGHGKLFRYSKEKHDVEFKSPEGWYLNGVIVDSAYRRKGVAKALLSFRESYVLEKEGGELYSIVSAENHPSISYHTTLGFVEQQRAPGYLSVRLKCGEGILFHKLLSTH